MASRDKKTKFSAKKLLKIGGIMLVCIYATFILIEQQMTLATIESEQQKYSDKISAGNLETQALQDKLKKAELVNDYIETAEAEKEASKSENGEAKPTSQSPTNSSDSTDAYIEQVIRDTLGYVKPNERVFIDISRDK